MEYDSTIFLNSNVYNREVWCKGDNLKDFISSIKWGNYFMLLYMFVFATRYYDMNPRMTTDHESNYGNCILKTTFLKLELD